MASFKVWLFVVLALSAVILVTARRGKSRQPRPDLDTLECGEGGEDCCPCEITTRRGQTMTRECTSGECNVEATFTKGRKTITAKYCSNPKAMCEGDDGADICSCGNRCRSTADSGDKYCRMPRPRRSGNQGGHH